jgi:hypothetical protein
MDVTDVRVQDLPCRYDGNNSSIHTKYRRPQMTDLYELGVYVQYITIMDGYGLPEEVHFVISIFVMTIEHFELKRVIITLPLIFYRLHRLIESSTR